MFHHVTIFACGLRIKTSRPSWKQLAKMRPCCAQVLNGLLVLKCKFVTFPSAHNGCAVVCDETRRALGGVSKATGIRPSTHTPQISNIKSHVTRHTSHVTRHTSHINYHRSPCLVPHHQPQRARPCIHDKAAHRHHRHHRCRPAHQHPN